ncbi:MAG TPA: hypothetical protein VMT20_23180 [Terriglobia bacterium]|nr:hypothetical protein [Terriglobia bacterium]
MHAQSGRESWMTLIVGCVSVLIALPLAAKQRKPAGEISDKKAFQNVQHYCIDLSGLEDYESYDVRGFIERESRPGKLLTKIPWKIAKDCDDSGLDATIKIEFPRARVDRLGSGPPPAGPGDRRPAAECGGWRPGAALPYQGRTSGDQPPKQRDDLPVRSGSALARRQRQGPVAAADTTQRSNAMYGAFWTLAQDIKRVSP